YKFEAAINKLVFRHEMLRAVTKNEEFGIILNKVPQIKINTIEDDREIDLIIEEIKKFSFDVNRFPGFRFILINKPDHDVLFFQGCLFFLDASSWSCFIHEVISAYEGKLIDEVTPSSSFVKFADSVSKLKYSEDFIKDLEYWKIKKLNYGRPEFFPVNNLESKIISPSFQSIRSDIAPYIFDSIKRKAKNIISTPTACLLGLYALIVGRWSNASNVAINIVASYKGKPRDVLGNYGFLLPLLVKNITTATTIGEFLTQVTHTLKTDLKHMSCSISDMVSHYPGGFRDIRAPLFPLVFTPVLKSKIISDFDIISGIKMIKGITKTPQVWIDNQVFSTDDGGFGVKWDYVEQLFERTTIEAMHKHYCGLINYLAQANWETDNFTELQLLSQDLKLINRANSATREIVSDTLFTYYTNNIIKNRLEDNIAVIDHIQTIKQDVISYIDNKYTYKQLLNNSELLARYILNSLSSQNLYNQFQPGELIAILSEKGYNQVVSSLAIMQAGFGYLPLNIDWPATRVNEVLIQGSVDTVLLSRKQYVKIGEQLQARYNLFIIENILDELTLDTELEVKIKKLSLPKVKPDDIAYVIFTSGSTGIPKGVTISHKGVLNTLLAVNKKYNVTARDKILALSEFSFDLSVYDIFGLLSEGGTIIFPEQDKLKDPIHWLELINRYKISIWNTVPQLAELLVHHAQDSVLYITSLRLFLLSGDWIPINLPALIKEVTPKASVLSLGGATEGSIWSIWYEINKIDSQWKAIPYGIAMPNQKMYVLSHNFEHCPPGVIGEIYIGGLGVALNYYNNKKMTAASFINHPVLGLVYKTGDMGLWSRRGYIKFGGRVDNQVKINGYRIELREIEIQLNKYPELKQAIVLVLEHVGTERNLTGNKYLAAYYVAESKLDEVAILNHLRQELPDYMVPDILIYLQNIPLTANGKLDRKLLPNPNLVDMDSKYIAPRDELDKSLIQVFANVLGLADDKLSINADFFKLGGNSILAIKLVTQINKQIAR
ncbi:MAG: hypothetical protein K0R49_1696, partial [Burkholderiales bacterium]|nr:hypothetical protein [Burkholderiales bacterium]